MKINELNESRSDLIREFPFLQDMGISENDTISRVEPTVMQIAQVVKYIKSFSNDNITATLRDISSKPMSDIDYSILKRIYDVVYIDDECASTNFMLTINSLSDTTGNTVHDEFKITEHKNFAMFSTILLNKMSLRDYIAVILFIQNIEQ